MRSDVSRSPQDRGNYELHGSPVLGPFPADWHATEAGGLTGKPLTDDELRLVAG